jgi:hypothetical protein
MQTHPSTAPRALALLPSIVFGGALLALASLSACGDDTKTNPPPPTFQASLNAANERPTSLTLPGTGSATVVQNGTTFTYTVNYANLTGTPTLSHIHGPADATKAVGVLVNFNIGTPTSGTGSFTGTFTPADIVPASGQPAISMDSLVTLMRTGNAYVNVHTSANKGGEIRGQLTLK